MLKDAEKALFAEIGQTRQELLAARGGLFDAKKSGDQAKTEQAMAAFLPKSAKMQDLLQQLVKNQRDDIDAQAQAINQANNTGRMALIAFGLFALAAGFGLTIWLARTLTRPINQAVEVSDRIAALDLSERIDAHDNDETGHLLSSLQSMQESLKTLVTEFVIQPTA